MRDANTVALNTYQENQDQLQNDRDAFELKVKPFLDTLAEAKFFIVKEAEDWEMEDFAKELILERINNV